jgi:alcohol dehydrogenase
MLLPSVVRWNESAVGHDYAWLHGALAHRLEELAEAGGLRSSLRAIGVSETELPELASEAAAQWTGTFNPRPFDKQGAIEIYQCVY